MLENQSFLTKVFCFFNEIVSRQLFYVYSVSKTLVETELIFLQVYTKNSKKKNVYMNDLVLSIVTFFWPRDLEIG